jgi:hypothetical protein
MAANSWNPSSFVFSIFTLISLVFPRTSLRASCEIYREDGCMRGKLDLV